MKKIFLLLLLFTSCSKCPNKVPPFAIQEFNGREELVTYGQTVRRPVYRAKVPLNWTQINPKDEEALHDTKKPIVSFVLDEALFVTVHTFPSSSLEERIAPEAQIERWKEQIGSQDCTVQRVSYGGFSGLFLEATKDQKAVLAWSLQLDLDHYQTLHFLAQTLEEEEHYKQMAADYTIKVTGPIDEINKRQIELFLFAESFELIQPIPQRT